MPKLISEKSITATEPQLKWGVVYPARQRFLKLSIKV